MILINKDNVDKTAASETEYGIAVFIYFSAFFQQFLDISNIFKDTKGKP